MYSATKTERSQTTANVVFICTATACVIIDHRIPLLCRSPPQVVLLPPPYIPRMLHCCLSAPRDVAIVFFFLVGSVRVRGGDDGAGGGGHLAPEAGARPLEAAAAVPHPHRQAQPRGDAGPHDRQGEGQSRQEGRGGGG